MKKKTGYLLLLSSLVIITAVVVLILNNYTRFSVIDNDADTGGQPDNYYQRGSIDETSEGKKVNLKVKEYACGTSIEKRNQFITEYTIPIPCTQPVGIAVDSVNKVWIGATWIGYLIVFDPRSETFADFIKIPNWLTKGTFGSFIWGMEFDKKGNLWFTDQVNNAIWKYENSTKRFEMYVIPTRGSYPVQVAFDSKGNVWFSEIFGKKIGVVEPHKAKNGTSEGITEYELTQIDFETMGPISIGKNDTVWLTAVSFPEAGNIVKFNPTTKDFTVFDLPKGIGVPVGITEDDYGRVWVNDHATNLFLMFDPSKNTVKKYSTSLPTSRNSTTTLPYWNEVKGSKVWFNEHEGNAIGYYDFANQTLVEYQIPTRSVVWGNTSNPLRFALDDTNSVWFTEWTENRIGLLNSSKYGNLPIYITVSKDSIHLNKSNLKSESIDVSVYPNTSKLTEAVKMTVAGSMSQSGRLWNLTEKFSEDSFRFLNNTDSLIKGTPQMPHIVSLTLSPTADLLEGNYTLTIGARYGPLTYSKIVNLQVS